MRWSLTTKTTSGPVELSLPLDCQTSKYLRKSSFFSAPTKEITMYLECFNEQTAATVKSDEIDDTTNRHHGFCFVLFVLFLFFNRPLLSFICSSLVFWGPRNSWGGEFEGISSPVYMGQPPPAPPSPQCSLIDVLQFVSPSLN